MGFLDANMAEIEKKFSLVQYRKKEYGEDYAQFENGKNQKKRKTLDKNTNQNTNQNKNQNTENRSMDLG